MTTNVAERTFAFETFDVFTRRRFGGNQLAIFTDARGLSTVDMQTLAAEMNLSETTFVLPPDDSANAARVRIFHRTGEMPFAGHPTLGTGVSLARRLPSLGSSFVLEVKAGLVRVTIERDAAGRAIGGTIEAPEPLTLGEEVPRDVVAACAGLDVNDVCIDHHAPIVASVGTPYVIAEVNPDALTRASPVLSAFRTAVADRPHFAGRLSLHLYARDGVQIRARMFAPIAGTWEDPATGSANTALVALLLHRAKADHLAVQIVQGVEMGRRSELSASARRSAEGIIASIGGRCVPVLAGVATV
jgi:trans-2,3-dihydro-3-hydroxyanthranilate isomerase